MARVTIPARPGRLLLNRRQFVGGTIAAGAFSAAPLRFSQAQQTSALPSGMAIVCSPRIPLFDLSSAQVSGLLTGSIANWSEVGSAVSLPVELMGLEGALAQGSTPAQTFGGYDEMADAMLDSSGGVALVSADQIDHRVNVLAVDGYDPVRHGSDSLAPSASVAFVGDIVPGRNVHYKMLAYNDFTHPFLRIAPQLSSYDLTIGNLEGNLSSTIEAPTDAHTFSFVSSPAMIDGFKLAGIDAMTQANNHSTWNSEGWGKQALLDTIDSLDSAGMGRFGAGRDLAEARSPLVTTVGDQSIAIIGIDGVTANSEARDSGATVNGSEAGGDGYAGAGDGVPGTYPYDSDLFLADIADLASQYDVVIPYFHFGIEYVSVPPDWAIEGAKAAIDAGASAVVTNHPHVIQGMQRYAGKPIIYSVGNFVFDQMFAVEVREGMILELDFRDGQPVGVRCRGISIEDFNQPRLMSAGEHASLMDRFWIAADRLAAR